MRIVNTMKRALFLMLALLLPLAVGAVEVQINGLWYDIDTSGSTAEVIRTKYSDYSGSVSIPNSVRYSLRDYSVTSIGDHAFDSCYGLTSVTIGNSVTSIGSLAFFCCIGLTSVTIGSSVTYIGRYAFSGCSGLTSVIIRGCHYIDDGAFEDCSGLTSVTIPNGVTSIGDGAFRNCTGLTSVTIPNSVTSIGRNAFTNCTGLTSISLPSSLKSVGHYAFQDCNNLKGVYITNLDAFLHISFGWYAPLFYAHHLYLNGKEVTGEIVFPSDITSVSNVVFEGCTGITSVVIPEGVKSIGQAAFKSCPNLKSVKMPSTLTEIAREAFQDCSGLTSVTIGNTEASIGDMAFSGCTNIVSLGLNARIINDNFIGNWFSDSKAKITSLTIGESVTSIGSSAFSGCSGLTSVTIPENLTSIGNSAFSDCTRLTSVIINSNAIVSNTYSSSFNLSTVFGNQVKEYVLGENVKTIGYYAFYDSYGLASVIIPNGVTSIGSNAFYNCRGLTSVTIPNRVTSIGNSAFSNCSGINKVVASDIAAWCGIQFGNASSNPLYYAKHLYRDANTEITDLVIPNRVTSISSNAFYNCRGLTSVTIPNRVTSIGSDAFYNCSNLNKVVASDISAWCGIQFGDAFSNPLYYAKHLYRDANSEITDLVIPNRVTSISSNAFYNCRGLTSVTIPNSVASIGNDAFANCANLVSVTLNANGIVSKPYTSNSNLKTIFGSQVTDIIIGDDVTAIGDNAFYGYSSLTALLLPSSLKSISSSAFKGCRGITGVTIRVNDVAELCDNNVVAQMQSSFDNPVSVQLSDPDGNDMQEVRVPESVTAIGIKGFMKCTGLKTVVMGNGVTSIGDNAFDGCTSLQNITIARTVESIGSQAFANCKNLDCVISLVDRLFIIDDNTFTSEAYINAQLLVPMGQLSKYKNVRAWSNFLTIEERDFLSKHKLTYLVDGAIYKQYELGYDEVITPEENPKKEGYTFSGWSDIPNRMPSSDVNITGMFTVNQYQVTFVVDGAVIATTLADYGSTVTPPQMPEKEGYTFAWTNLPGTMPAQDIVVYGKYIVCIEGVEDVATDEQDGIIYDLSGRKILTPKRGANIIRMGDGTTKKVIKK